MFNKKLEDKIDLLCKHQEALENAFVALSVSVEILANRTNDKKRGRPTNAARYGMKKDGTPKKKPGRKKTT